MVLKVKRYSQAAAVKPDGYWKSLVDENGTGTKMMWRLADSVFFYMQETRRVWHGIDASQFYWLLCTAAVEPDDIVDQRVLNLSRYLDDAGVHYTRVTVNGQSVPTLDRTSWFNLMSYEARTAPDYAFEWWSSLIATLPLLDPHNHTPFPGAPPRICFPAAALENPSCDRAPLRPGMPAPVPSYVFAPRLNRYRHHDESTSRSPNASGDPDDASCKRAKRKLTKPSSWANVFGHSNQDNAKLQKKGKASAASKRGSAPPPAPPIRFVADGRMHKAHERNPDPEHQFVRPIVNAQTLPTSATPRTTVSWPDTRGLPLPLRKSSISVPVAQVQRRSLDTGDVAGRRAHLAPGPGTLELDESLVPFAAARSFAAQSTPDLISGPAMRAVVKPRDDKMHSVVSRVLALNSRPRPVIPRLNSNHVVTVESAA